MATPEEEQRQIAQGLVGRAAEGRAAVERLQLQVQDATVATRKALMDEKLAELQKEEGFFGDPRTDEVLGPIWDAYVTGDPANGIPPLVDAEAQNLAVSQIDRARVESGAPSIQNTVAEWQKAEQFAAPHQQAIAEQGFVETPEQVAAKKEEADFQRMSSASAAFQDQVARPKAQRNENVINAVEAAMEGGEQSIEAFTKQIESIGDTELRDQTIQLAQRAGMQFGRPITISGPGGDQSVEYPFVEGAFNDPAAVQLREGIKGSASQFAQDGVATSSDGQSRRGVGPGGAASGTTATTSGGSAADGGNPITFDDGASRFSQGVSTAQQVGSNIQNTADTAYNMLFGAGSPDANEARRRAEGGEGIFRAAGEVAGPVINQMGESAGDFLSNLVVPRGFESQQEMDASTARTMQEIQNRPGPAHRPGGVFYNDPNAPRPVDTQPLDPSDTSLLFGPTDVESQPLTAEDRASLAARSVPSQPLSDEELASLGTGPEQARLTAEYNATPNQNRHKSPNLTPRQIKLLADDEALMNSASNFVR